MENTTTMVVPLFSEKTFLLVFAGLLFFALVGAVCLTILFRKDPESIGRLAKTDMFYIITVLVVVFATGVLALQGILDGKAVSAILGGVVGYVLGSIGKRQP